MAPAGKVPGSAATSAEGWESWWRNHVMSELERLDGNVEALRGEFEGACRNIRDDISKVRGEMAQIEKNIQKDLATVDKTASVDIRDLQVRAAIAGVIGGVLAGGIMAFVLFLVEKRLFG